MNTNSVEERFLMVSGNRKKQKGFNGPPTARSEPDRD